MPLLFVLFLVPFFAHARTDKKVDLRPQGVVKTEDPGSATRLLYEKPKREKEEVVNGRKTKVSINATCTDQLGMIFKQGDQGYEGCLRTMNRTKPGDDKRHQPSIGITVGQ